MAITDEDSLKKISNEFEKRENQLTLPVLGNYIAKSGVGYPVDKKITNFCGMRCILSCDKACDRSGGSRPLHPWIQSFCGDCRFKGKNPIN